MTGEHFNLAEWLTAAGALAAAAVAALGVRSQWESDEPVIEAVGRQLDNGLIWVKGNVMRRNDRTILVHAAKVKKPQGARIGLDTKYYGQQDGFKFTLPFRAKRIPLQWEVAPVGGTFSGGSYLFDVFLQPHKKAASAFSIAFLVSIKSRPKRKRWITVSSTVTAIKTPHAPIKSA